MIQTILITGANSGLGKEAARQFANFEETERVFLACRNMDKAKAAKKELEASTGRQIFEIILMDVSDLTSVRKAVNGMERPVDAAVLNAGGMGGTDPGSLTSEGVTQMTASNVLGHALLLDELLKAGKLLEVAVYAGSEAARGVPIMGMRRPSLPNYSISDFKTICDGTVYGDFDPMQVYGAVKYLGAMLMGAMARKHPKVRFITMSPGGTSGTDVMRDAPALLRFVFERLGSSVLPLFGFTHSVDVGAARYVKAVTDRDLTSGGFYASKRSVPTGKVVDQSIFLKELANESFQDNAYEAIHSFLK